MRCSNCGLETHYLINGQCLTCLWQSDPKQYVPSNWCPVHGAWAAGILRCPACETSPPIPPYTIGCSGTTDPTGGSK